MTFWDWLEDMGPFIWIVILPSLLILGAIFIETEENPDQDKAEDQCLAQGGVPLYGEYNRLVDCKFKPQ